MNNLLLINKKLDEQAKRNNAINSYASRHVYAWSQSPIARMLDALALYADDYQKRYDTPLVEDYVLGQYWIESLKGVRGLLNGEIGQLDGAFTDEIIVKLSLNNGFNDELEFTNEVQS